MVDYYCETCGVEVRRFNFDPARGRPVCPNCSGFFHGGTMLIPMPVYETVPQWEARTGLTYPDTAPVYVMEDNVKVWTLWKYCQSVVSDMLKGRPCVVAAENGAPPEDWRPK